MFVLWAVIGDDPFGGEPMVAVPVDLHAAMMPKTSEQAVRAGYGSARRAGCGKRYDGPLQRSGGRLRRHRASSDAANTKTVTIIDGKTGERQEVVIPAPATDAPVRRTPRLPSRNSSR